MQKQRASMYQLLSRLLLEEVNEDILNNITNNEEILSLFESFKEWEVRKKISTKRLIDEHLNVDFADISLLHLIPYESFYRRDDGMVESGGANLVINFYNELGFRVDLDKARAISPDHIGIELEFLALLIEHESKNSLYRQKQVAFLEEHLLKWCAMYLMAMHNEAQTPFYKDLSRLALEFILSDYEYLKAS